MMTDSKSDEPEDLIEPLPGNNTLFIIHLHAYFLSYYVVTHWVILNHIMFFHMTHSGICETMPDSMQISWKYFPENSKIVEFQKFEPLN